MSAEAAFRSLFAAAYADVVRYVARRTTDDPEDIAAEAFAVVWRRWSDVPREPDAARAYAFGVARRILLAQQGRSSRRAALSVRLAGESAHVGSAEEMVVPSVTVQQAWAQLEADQQEVLALAMLDGLPSAAAGRVLGISAGAYRIRLSRARAALAALVETEPPPVPIPVVAKGRF